MVRMAGLLEAHTDVDTRYCFYFFSFLIFDFSILASSNFRLPWCGGWRHWRRECVLSFLAGAELGSPTTWWSWHRCLRRLAPPLISGGALKNQSRPTKSYSCWDQMSVKWKILDATSNVWLDVGRDFRTLIKKLISKLRESCDARE